MYLISSFFKEKNVCTIDQAILVIYFLQIIHFYSNAKKYGVKFQNRFYIPVQTLNCTAWKIHYHGISFSVCKRKVDKHIGSGLEYIETK